MFNIALISRCHPHAKENRYVNQLKDISEAKITYVWDEDKERGMQWADELSVAFEPNFDALLEKDDVDGIVITSSTEMHKEIIIKAAKKGKHVFTEKALAMNYKEALEIKKVVDESGIEFGIVFPRRAKREYNYAKKLIDNGAFGEISLIRIRVAVTNLADLPNAWFMSEAEGGGGGAIRDLSCHTIDLACWYLGEPESINVTKGYIRNHSVEDTGICNIKFKNGAVAVLDSNYAAPLSDNWYTLEIYGSEMAYIAGTHDVTMIKIDRTKENPGVQDVIQEVISVNEVDDVERPLPIQQWINAATGQGENLCTIDAGVMVNKVLDAADKAAEENRTVEI